MRNPWRTCSISSLQSSCIVWNDSCGVAANALRTSSNATKISANPGLEWLSDAQQAKKLIFILKFI